MTKKSFTIIWKEFSQDSPLGEHLKVTQDFSLPYLIDEDEIKQMENNQITDLKEIHLIKGIALGYSDQPDLDNIEYSKTLFPIILTDMVNNLQIKDTETLLLDISAFIRQENGIEASFMALKNATEMKPKSSKLKFDCCVTLYNLLQENLFPDFKEGVRLINKMADEIKPEEISPELRKHIKQFKIG